MNEFQSTTTTREVNPPVTRRVSWGAVFAGLAIGLAIQILLSMLGVAVGASTIDPLHGDTPGKGMAIGAGIWLLISGIISTYIGACIAAHLSGAINKSDRMLHGLMTWGAATLLTAFVLSSALGNMIGGAMRMAAAGAGAAGGAQAVAQLSDEGNPSARLNANMGSTRQEAAGGTGEVSAQNRGTSGQQQYGAANSQQYRGANANAQQYRGGTGQQYQYSTGSSQTEQKAREVGDTAARGTSVAAWWSFFMLLLGLGAAAVGGSVENHFPVRRTTYQRAAVP